MSLSSPLALAGKDNNAVFSEIGTYLSNLKLTVATIDSSRPWGGFFVLEESQAELFRSIFFSEIPMSELVMGGKLSPKILVVQAGKRLSWQYHHRRAEIWRVVSGTVGVVTSENDKEGALQKLSEGHTIRLRRGERHRLIGLTGWGVVAEIWQHTDKEKPSDEADIVRLQDDFGR